MQRLRTVSTQETESAQAADRRGAVLLWFIAALPVLLTLLCVLLEVGNLYLARAELMNSLEAAAQAAVKDWAENGDILEARILANQYAMANTINGIPVDLTSVDDDAFPLNHDPNNPLCNFNRCRDGVLVFGAIVGDTPNFVFNCCETPTCAVGTVWLDVSAQSALGGSDNEWGISFQPNIFPLPPGTDLRITRVVYVLPDTCERQNGNGGSQTISPRFDFTSSPTTVSSSVTDNDPNVVVSDLCNETTARSAQSDVFGIAAGQVRFFVDLDLNADLCDPNNGTDRTGMTHPTLTRSLAVQFPDDDGVPLAGFDIEDHIRFGATVTNEGGAGANANVGGDEIGQCMTQVTICFNDGTSCTTSFFDNNHRSNDCFPASPFGGNTKCAGVAPWGTNVNPPPNSATNHGLIIHPSGVPDLPCPPSAAANNNGQSLASVVAGDCNGGTGAGPAFAVRAQATYPVESICSQLFGIEVGPFFVTARADALYDCGLRMPRLYHLKPENLICPLNCP